MTLHSYANGLEIFVPVQPAPLVQEVAPGTVIVFVAGQAIQVQELVQQIQKLLEQELRNGP